MSEDARLQALRALSQFLVADVSLSDTLLRVSRITTDAMPSAEMAGISLLDDDGKPTTAVFTDESRPRSTPASTPRAGARASTRRASNESCASMTWTGLQSTIRSSPSWRRTTACTARCRFPWSSATRASDLATAAAIVLANASAYEPPTKEPWIAQ